jgi:hypothetical protein
MCTMFFSQCHNFFLLFHKDVLMCMELEKLTSLELGNCCNGAE